MHPTGRPRRAGLRANVTCIRNDAEKVDAYTKVMLVQYTNKSTGKDCALNKCLRDYDLNDCGNKKERCERLASYLVKNNIDLDGDK